MRRIGVDHLENPVDGVLAGGGLEIEAADVVSRGHVAALGIEQMVDGGVIFGKYGTV